MMKRHVVSVANTDADSDDWQSGSAAVFDSLDDVMWDELRDLSSPDTPQRCETPQIERPRSPLDVIRGASPVNSPNAHMQMLSQYGRGGISPICGDSPISGGPTGIQRNELMTDGDFNLGLGYDLGAGAEAGASHLSDWAVGMIIPPVATSSVELHPAASTGIMPMAWGEISSDQSLLISTQQSTESALERRRQKNRDCMRRARQKQREETQNMKRTVECLEKQYAELSMRSSNVTTDLFASSNSEGALVAHSRVATEYTQAVELVRRLGAENLYLKAEIQQQTEWKLKLNLSRLMQSLMEDDGPRWAPQFQQPALGGEEILWMQLDKVDEMDAREEYGYHVMSDLDLTHVILENQHTIARVQSQLLIPSSFDSEGGARTRRMQTFGWDMVQRVHGNIMECVFTKKFRGLDVAQLMQKTWANDMRVGEYKKVKGETCRLEVLQQINANAYVLCRDVMSPTEDISTFRSVYVRFLIEKSKKIPVSTESSSSTGIDASAPSTPPQHADSDSDCEELMLEATGYVLGTQCVDTDYSRNPRAEDIFNKVAWAHVSLSIEFLNVVNPLTGEEYQQLYWSGRTNYCGEEHAQRNASDMMQGLLRWELLVISPALNLVSLSLE